MNNTEKMLVDEIEKNKKLETELVSIKEKLTKECIRFSRVCEDLSDILSGGGNPKKYIIYTEYPEIINLEKTRVAIDVTMGGE